MAGKEKNDIRPATAEPIPCAEHGKFSAIDDPELQQFYGLSTTESYRLKSELVGKCLEEKLAMGR